MSLAPVLIVAVYVVFAARLLAGVKVAVVLVLVTVPKTDVEPCLRVSVVAFSVDWFIASLKVTAMFLLRATPIALLAGSVEATVGGVISGAAPVVKLHT